MARELLDCRGMKCPQPVLKIAAKSAQMNAGDVLEVLGDCSTFEKDVRAWCTRTSKTLMAVNNEGTAQKAMIQL
jgi:tRNA 2-thiouridine synthesizing protein A